MAKKDPEALGRTIVRLLYKGRPSRERTEARIFLYCRWLAKRYAELLPRRKGDLSKHLKADLKGLYTLPKLGRCFPRWGKLYS
jgi:hypothetical protein